MHIKPAVYKIKEVARPDHVISLENGDPRGNLVVEPVKPTPVSPNQLWAVVDQYGGIYTFKSLIKNFEGGDDIPESKKPYAGNSEDDNSDHFIRGSAIDVFATYKIIPTGTSPYDRTFMIRLPERDKFWTVDNNNKIILDVQRDQGQLWKFDLIGDFPK